MKLRLYKSYNFRDKDPVIDKLRTLVKDELGSVNHKAFAEISADSNVATGTLNNWFNGTTKRPQFATVAAVAGALGKDVDFVSKRKK